MTISTKILLDSVNPFGVRLTSWILTFPRIILAEVGTHRVFSRSSASSRAIPFQKALKRILDDPFVPVRWGKNQKGMSADEPFSSAEASVMEGLWRGALGDAVEYAKALEELGLHKQWVNRLLEPWSHITVLVTTSYHENFFGLRAHAKAPQPEFQVLGYRMLSRFLKSQPQRVGWGEWHIPFSAHSEGLTQSDKLKVATARAARLSYLTFDSQEISVEKDLELYDRLKDEGHLGPFEHSAQADSWIHRGHSNLGTGWHQYRKMIAGECREPDLQALLDEKPDWITLEDDEGPVPSTETSP